MFTVQGSVLRNIEEKEGISKKGTPYKISQWIVDIGDGSGKSVLVFKVFGDLSNQLHEGQRYNFGFFINAREYNGRYYTELNLKECNVLPASAGQGCQEYRPGQETPSEGPETSGESPLLDYIAKVDSGEIANDLPF